MGLLASQVKKSCGPAAPRPNEIVRPSLAEHIDSHWAFCFRVRRDTLAEVRESWKERQPIFPVVANGSKLIYVLCA